MIGGRGGYGTGGDRGRSANAVDPGAQGEGNTWCERRALRPVPGGKTCEKNWDRVERRTAYSTDDVEWLSGRKEWESLVYIGAVNTRFTGKKGITNEWHYYISSRELTAEELLKHARLEWSVETMHWLLDVHFCEDFCRAEDENVQQNLNIIRKIALNSIKLFNGKNNNKFPRRLRRGIMGIRGNERPKGRGIRPKEIKRPLSEIILDCLALSIY